VDNYYVVAAAFDGLLLELLPEEPEESDFALELPLELDDSDDEPELDDSDEDDPESLLFAAALDELLALFDASRLSLR
jgi:hypothetical protein